MKPIYIFGRKKIRELEEQLGKLQKETDNYMELYQNSESKRIEIMREVYGLERSLDNAQSRIYEFAQESDKLKELVSKLQRALDVYGAFKSDEPQPRDEKGRFTKKK